ncbi:response regulator [Geomesophilobacter sediminis]|uniref:Response regulator n=1 Tax=Geomesophilobacter sediminis TaxID=2798584 RepID=A0A8J7JLV1_9BACT|nr:response regulator [Geomesophilobacter sediminis]MBJ6725415.1 response regulator [Geomesophilobacter sediminis]
MKTLIVDDSFLVREILKDTLSPLGECDITVNGREAVLAFQRGLVKKEPYDLICMDVKMPEMDGNEALRQIREIERDCGIANTKEVKVIMITAVEDPKSVIDSFYNGGATSYLTKPFDDTMVMEEIEKLGLWP